MNRLSIPVTLSLENTLEALDHDPSRFVAIAVIVIEDLPLLVDELRLAISEGDERVARSMLQAMQGFPSNFRAEPLLQFAIAFEQSFDALTCDELNSYLIEISDVCDGTVRALENAVESLSLST